MTSRSFTPDWTEPPGATIAALLNAKSLLPDRFAELAAVSRDLVERLISGEAAIDAEIALHLSTHLGSSVGFWLSREDRFRRIAVPEVTDTDIASWLRDLPVSDMVKLGWIQPESLRVRASECLRFFGVRDGRSWEAKYSTLLEQVAFRTSNSFDSKPASVVAWLRYGELVADELVCEHWDATNFARSLDDVRALTRIAEPAEFLPKLQEICARSGVAVVVARAPKGCTASGATRFLSPTKAVLMLSFRHLTDDHFWFSFFHEAGHLILHGNDSLFVDGKGLDVSDREREADDFAVRMLIPDPLSELLDSRTWDYKSVIRVARKLGVSRGVIVGQLQHRGKIGFDRLNFLKTRYRWTA
jgi:plasmid maintenance system antidote protein VapI